MSDDEVYTVDCTDCHAKAGDPCLYLPLANIDPAFVHYRSPAVQRRHALTGTPTKRPHNGRCNAYAALRARRMARERQKANRITVRPVSPGALAIARAERAFDLREAHRLRAWLAAFGHILTDPAAPGEAPPVAAPPAYAGDAPAHPGTAAP